METQDHQRYEATLGAHEQAIEALTADVGKLGRTLEETTRGIFQAIDRLSDKVAAGTKTNWGTVASIAGVAVASVLGIGGAIGSGYVRDLNRLEGGQSVSHERITKLADAVNDREFARGQQYQRIADLTDGQKSLDTRLQMEMRLVNDTTEAKLNELDRRLQGEIKTVVIQEAEMRQRVRERVETLEEEMKDTREASARLQERAGVGKVK